MEYNMDSENKPAPGHHISQNLTDEQWKELVERLRKEQCRGSS